MKSGIVYPKLNTMKYFKRIIDSNSNVQLNYPINKSIEYPFDC